VNDYKVSWAPALYSDEPDYETIPPVIATRTNGIILQ